MKNTLRILALTLCLCLFAGGCSGQKPSQTAAVTAPSNETGEMAETPFVPHRISWDDINAIPVATPEMSEEELRQICVDFASLQQSFYYTPSHPLDYMAENASTADKNGKLHIQTGKVYGGLPYGSGGMSIYSAMDYYNSETGVLDTSEYTGKAVNGMSNHCSSSVMWGWARVSSTLNYHLTHTMTAVNGCIPIGPYTYPATLEQYDEMPTKDICKNNGEQTMFESFALLKKADGVVCYGKDYGGHTRMILEDATVVRNADGTIDPDQSFVTSVEQYSTFTNIEVEGTTVIQHGEPNKQYTFKQMYNSGYLPFTIPELCGMAKVEKAYAKIDHTGNTIAYDELRGCAIESNYAIAKVMIKTFDEGGSVTESKVLHIRDNPVRSYALSSVFAPREASAYKAASRVLIEVFSGSGETLTIFDGDIQ